MKKISIILLCILFFIASYYQVVADGTLRTCFSNDWDCWEFEVDGEDGEIETFVSEDWDHWEITDTSNDVDITARTFTSEDWDYWEFSGDVNITIRTFTSEDWDYWEIDGDLSELAPEVKVAILFIPLFTSSIYIHGIIQGVSPDTKK